MQETNPVLKRLITVAGRAPVTVQPSRLLLLRELGLHTPHAGEDIVDWWASELERRTLFHATYRASMGPDITQFVRDDLTKIFLYTQATLELDMQRI